MSEEERLSLNNYLENLYQAWQVGNIVFEAKHSSELYNLINKLLEENQKYKEVIDKANKWVRDYMDEWNMNDEVWQDLNDLLILLEEVEHEKSNN